MSALNLCGAIFAKNGDSCRLTAKHRGPHRCGMSEWWEPAEQRARTAELELALQQTSTDVAKIRKALKSAQDSIVEQLRIANVPAESLVIVDKMLGVVLGSIETSERRIEAALTVPKDEPQAARPPPDISASRGAPSVGAPSFSGFYERVEPTKYRPRLQLVPPAQEPKP